MSNASDFTIKHGNWNDPNAVALEKYTGTDAHVVIPDGVTLIAWNAFAQNQTLREVTIPESVKTIWSNAFYGCEQLEKVNILGAGLEALGEGCFDHCTALREIRLPDSVRQLPDKLFVGCTALQKDTGYFTVAGEVLLKCSDQKLPSVLKIPEGVRFISGAVFGNSWNRSNKSVQSVTTILIPEGVVHIGENTFTKMESLRNVEFPRSLRTLGSMALGFLPKLQRVDLSRTALEVLEKNQFACNEKMQEVLLPQGLKRIEDGVFNGCGALKKIQLPDSLESIGGEGMYIDGAFQASGLEEIRIPEGVKTLIDRTFLGCAQLKSVVLPDSLERIGSKVFKGCKSLTDITIPENVTAIGEDAFRHCCTLRRPTLGGKLQADEDFWGRIGFGDENGCVVKDGVLTKYVGPTDIITITEGVTEIPERVLNVGGLPLDYPTEYRLPQSLKVFHEQNLGKYYRDKVNLPAGYLQTQNALPAKYTLALLGGAWQSQAVLKDYAALYLFQKGKELVKLCEVKLINAPKETIQCFVELLSDGGKGPHVVKAAEFVMENQKKLSAEEIGQIYQIAVSKKAKKAVELLQPLAGVEEAAPKSKKASTHPIENFCKEKFVPHYLDKVSKKAKISDKTFEGVLYKDSKVKAPAFVVKCAIVPYIELMEERPKRIGGYKTDYLPVRFLEDADKVAAELDPTTLRAVLEKVADLKKATEKPQCLLPLCRYGSSEQIKNVISSIGKWDDWYTYASSGRSTIIVARGAILLSETREAMLYAEKCKILGYYARIRDMDEDVLRDTKLADFGFDENGCKQFDLGNTVIEASIGMDLSVILYDTKAQKVVKSLPKKGADPDKHAAASAELSDLKKNLKKVVKSRNDVLFDNFLHGKAQKASGWIGSYTKNPVLHRVAELIVWEQKGKTFILTKDGTVDCNGNSFQVSDTGSVGVAHPKDMPESERKAWQKYFTSNGLKQPFEQVWEPVVDPKSVKEDRYKDCMIPFYRFKGRAKHGIEVEDYNFHNDIYISFSECNATVARIDWARHSIDMNHRFEVQSFSFRRFSRMVNHIVAYLDRITVYGRVLNDDVTVAQFLPQFTLAQITEFINAAMENHCTSVLAILLDFKNTNFSDFDPMDEFSLDL